MTEKKVTITNLLTEDNRKRLAELLLNNDVTDMVVIYHEGDAFQCRTSTPAVATTIGMLEMAKTMVMNDWQYPGIYKDDSQESEEEDS
jgi:hypothetical protein